MLISSIALGTIVILFGSAANGKTDHDSDLDFMVVVPNRQKIDKVVDMLNCKYFVETRQFPLPPNFKLAYNGTYKIYENMTALQRAWFVNKLKVAETPKEALEHHFESMILVSK